MFQSNVTKEISHPVRVNNFAVTVQRVHIRRASAVKSKPIWQIKRAEIKTIIKTEIRIIRVKTTQIVTIRIQILIIIKTRTILGTTTLKIEINRTIPIGTMARANITITIAVRVRTEIISVKISTQTVRARAFNRFLRKFLKTAPSQTHLHRTHTCKCNLVRPNRPIHTHISTQKTSSDG